MFSGIRNINELIKYAAQFTLDQIYEQIKKKLAKQDRDLSKEEFMTLVNLDPTYQGDQEQGSYTHWILNQFLNDPRILTEDAEKIEEHLAVFDKIKHKLEEKDINKYKSDADLFDAIEPYLEEDLRSNRERMQVDTDDYDLIYSDEDWTIYSPNTWPASVMLGRGANWCTAANSEQGEYYFNDYMEDGNLYILLNNANPEEKYQFHFERREYTDKSNREINLGYFLSEEVTPGVREWIWDELGIELEELEISGEISNEILDYYEDRNVEDVVPSNILYNIFTKGRDYYKAFYNEELIEEGLGIKPDDNIDTQNFNYNLAYEVLIELFQEVVYEADEQQGIFSISLYPEQNLFRVWIDEEFQFNYFLNKILNNEDIDYYNLVDAGMVPYEIKPIPTEAFKEAYRERISEFYDKEQEEAGQMKLFDDTEYLEKTGKTELYNHMRNIDELITKFGDEDMNPTTEMENYFKERTIKHINLVQKYCEKIQEIYKDRFEGIIERGKIHDQSKWTEPEHIPYIFITWDYKSKDDGNEFDIPESFRIIMNDASEHHVNNNSHHPEYHCPKKGKINRENRDEIPDEIIDATLMGDLDIAEQVADWCAMSEERGNSPLDWADKNIGKRWKFSDEAVYLIYDIINNIWGK